MVSSNAVRRRVPPGELPDFTPVPRQCARHDGWTPERQRAVVAALADTGCVAIACRMVNMSPESFYQLRRQPGATSFRRACDAAQTLGLQPVRDEAFHRAMVGQLVPVFVGGKLMGFRRKKNDRLLMFILRHYGEDGQGRKTTVNYFSTRASAGAATNPPLQGEGDHAKHGGGVSASEASTTTVKTVISGPAAAPARIANDDEAANILNAFEGVALDETARGEIYRTLEACAERRRALESDPENDPECDFVRVAPDDVRYLGELESGVEGDWVEYRPEGEHRWEGLGEGGEAGRIDAVLEEMKRAREQGPGDPVTAQPENTAALPAPEVMPSPDPLGEPSFEPKPEPDPNSLPRTGSGDPRLDWRNWTDEGYMPPSCEPVHPEPEPTIAHPEPEPAPAKAGEGAEPEELDPDDPRLDWRSWSDEGYNPPPASTSASSPEAAEEADSQAALPAPRRGPEGGGRSGGRGAAPGGRGCGGAAARAAEGLVPEVPGSIAGVVLALDPGMGLS